MTPTRIIVKDNHRPSIVAPKINDMNPNEKLRDCPKIGQNICGNFTNPLSKDMTRINIPYLNNKIEYQMPNIYKSEY